MKTSCKISLCLIGLFLFGIAVYYLNDLNGEEALMPAGDVIMEPQRERRMSERRRRLKGAMRMDAPDQFAEFHRMIRTGDGASAPAYPPNYRIQALQKAWQQAGIGEIGKRIASKTRMNWIERGPGNVAGRARAILVDPDDATQRTWYVGSAGGGVWKTEDAGQSWQELTRDLPNLATTTLAMPASNPNVIYAGTGEGYGRFAFVYGQGIWRSSDKGNTWTQLPGTASDPAFTNVLRLVVDPEDENLLVAATSTGLRRSAAEESYIMRSTDGGVTWSRVYTSDARVEQVVATPGDFQVLYATVHGRGVLKSTDAGISWSADFAPFYDVGRLEMAIAPSDPSRLYVAAHGSVFGSTLFSSANAGESWELMGNDNENPPDWLVDLGWYCNTIAVDPFDANRVFVGGLDLYRFDLSETTFGRGHVRTVEVHDPENFMELDLVGNAPLIAQKLNGRPEISSSEFIEVEVRWGPGKRQKAHRFEGKWLATYQDYVDVDFEVWDVTNNRRLMIAYEDEDKDNQWDLSGALLAASERVFIIDETYNASSPNIPTTIDPFYRAMYVLTVTDVEGSDVDSGPFPEATIRIVPEIFVSREASFERVTDAYGDDPLNTKGVHVDHHQLLLIPNNNQNLPPIMLDANDGGIAVSYDYGATFTQTGDTFAQLHNGSAGERRPMLGLNTAQFYGVDKMNGEDRYVGGTQDNGSWVSPSLVSNTEPWMFAPSGDGFEAVWHYANPDWIIQSSQFNKLLRSIDGGYTWFDITPRRPGFFLTRIAKTNQQPDLLLVATPDGVARTEDFGDNWSFIDVADGWPEDVTPAVRISLASPDIVWAGAKFGGDASLFVSVDGALTFDKTPDTGISELGAVTEIATHPTEPNTAYALFSIAESPKIYKTTDLGQTWEDLSGFGTGSESVNGFPDVAVYSLLVMPHDTQVMWAGTEIGIFESVDSGGSWRFLDNGLPAVAVWQMRIVNDQVVAATHGRGVWTLQMPELDGYEPLDTPLAPAVAAIRGESENVEMDINLRATYDSTWVSAFGVVFAVLPANEETGVHTIQHQFSVDEDISGQVVVTGFQGGDERVSAGRSINLFSSENAVSSFTTDFEEDGAFRLDGFVIDHVEGFFSGALHSLHPYADFQDAVAVLKTPIVVNAEYPVLSYEEIALVEPAQEGAAFGTDAFYDYAIVEGSNDSGISWQALAEGYDVRRTPEWSGITDLLEKPNPVLFSRNEVNLMDTFSPGEEILIRFRLSSDNAVSGWGWVIDNLNVQFSNPVSNEEVDLPAEYALMQNYPNPFSTQTNIVYTLPEPAPVKLSVYDINGRLVQLLVDEARKPAGRYQVSWDGQTPWGMPVASGVFFYKIEAGEAYQQVRRLVKVR